MLTIHLDPILWHRGPLTLAWHGLFLTAGVALGFWVFARQARAQGVPREHLLELLLGALISGTAGARLLQVFVYRWGTYATQPLRVLALFEGGLAVYGGLIGGTLAVAAIARHRKLPFWRLADAAALGIASGLIVGRIGCTIAGDVCGMPTGGAWGLVYTHPGSSVPARLLGVPTFPAPIALEIANVALLAWLLVSRRRFRQPGTLFLAYLIAYSLARFVINIWQGERALLLGLHPTQVIAVVVALSAAAALLVRQRPAHSSPPPPLKAD